MFFGQLNLLLIDNLNRHPSQIYEAIFEGNNIIYYIKFFIFKR